MAKPRYMTVPEVANRLGISRISVYKKIKSGQIAAERVGRSFLIPSQEAHALISGGLTVWDKRRVRATVKRVVREYGPVLERLSRC